MTATTTDDLEAALLEAATQCQQNYYEICSDWNRYENDEHEYMKDFIGYALFGPPLYREPELPQEVDEKQIKAIKWKDNEESSDVHYTYEPKHTAVIKSVYDKVIEYGSDKDSEGIILCGIIYNVIYNKEKSLTAKNAKDTEDKEKTNKSENENANEKKSEAEELKPEIQVYPVPLFKVRRYQSGKTKKEKEAAKEPNIEKTYYIDNSARVYDGFLDYLQNNTLPQCTMVVPKDGRYQADPVSCMKTDFMKQNIDNVVTKVWVEVLPSPAGTVAAKVLLGGDIVSTAVTVASMGIGIAAMFTPIGAGVAAASAVGAGVSGLWSVGRCAQQLADRGQHGESINVTDKAALGAWIGIAGGTMGMAATGGSMLLTRAVRTGTTVGRVAMVTHDAVLIGNLIVNGVGVGYKGWDMIVNYMENGEISASDVFFLTTHIFFFCNSVVNIRLAQNFIETSQGQLLKDYEASLRSNRHRKEFQRMARNTRAAGPNDIASNEEIIRGINKIANKDEFFQAMVRNRKAFSASGAKASFADGKVTVNSVMTIDPIEFANLPKDVRVDIVKGVSSVPPSTSVPTKPTAGHTNNEVSYKNFTASSKTVLKDFCSQHSSVLLKTASMQIGDFENVLSDLSNFKNSAEIFMKLLNIGYKILQAMPREETTIGNVLSIIVQFLWDYVKKNMRYGNHGIILVDPSAQILLNKMINELFYRVEKQIDIWVKAFREWLENQYRQSMGGF